MKVLTSPRERENRNVTSILETVDVDSGKRNVMAEFENLIEAPNWTPDGKYLVYNSKGHIYTFDIATKEICEIYSGIAVDCNNDHILSLDGKQIWVSHQTLEDGQSRIYGFPLTGGEPFLVTPMAPSYLHGCSPDGKTLSYCGERNGQYDIYTIPAIGGNETQLTRLPGLDDGPEYSPCGKYIWFNSSRTGLMQIWYMDTDGSNTTQVTFDEFNSWFPHISRDGKRVAYIAYQKGDVEPGDHPANKNVEIRLLSVESGKSKTVVRLFGGQGTLNVNSWSPDNKTLAFVSYRLKV